MLVEETKLGCPPRIRTNPPDAAIALMGEPLPAPDSTKRPCHPLRLGLDPDYKDALLGLSGTGQSASLELSL